MGDGKRPHTDEHLKEEFFSLARNILVGDPKWKMELLKKELKLKNHQYFLIAIELRKWIRGKKKERKKGDFLAK